VRAAFVFSVAASGACLLLACADVDGGTPLPPDAIEASVVLEKRGDGRSEVITQPIGLVCDVSCAGVDSPVIYADEETLRLVVAPARDSNFVRAFCTSPDADTVQAIVNSNGTATIDLPLIVDDIGLAWSCVTEHRQVHTVQVLVATGSGRGRVRGGLSSSLDTDEPKRIDCPGDCVGAYFVDDVETLTAIADVGSVFVRWKVCQDSVDPTISLTISQDENCEAVFELAP